MAQNVQYPYLKQFYEWMNNPNTFIFGRWEGHPEGGYEGGMDLGAPDGTPVYAVATGPIQAAGYFCHGGPFDNLTPYCANGAPGYGVVTQRVDVPGYGPQDMYFQHIKIDPSIQLCPDGNCNQEVQAGQQIGTIYPGVGMLEIGFNANWGTVWGKNHPGAWVDDPRPLMKNLLTQGPIPQGLQTTTLGLSNPFDFFGWLGQFTALTTWLNNPLRVVKLVVGALLVGVSLIMLVAPQVEQTVTSVAGKAAKIGVLFA
jgi:hypothetical protein